VIERVAIFDTGAGNLHSLGKALARLVPNASIEVVDGTPRSKATLLVLPGVGAFGPAAARLAPVGSDMRAAIRDGLPTVGICLGMQLLFDASEEGDGEGLGAIEGRVTKLATARLPHMGWSRVSPSDRPELAWLRDATPSALYFAHSFACRPVDPSTVWATSSVPGDSFATIVRTANAVGCQFHPEKSSFAGLALLGRLIEEVTR
jgi:glutamine amidotransferase